MAAATRIFRHEGVDLTTDGSGEQRSCSGSADGSAQKLVGTGSPSGATSGTDGIVSASAAAAAAPSTCRRRSPTRPPP